MDAGLMSVAWAIIAATAGCGLAGVAITLARRFNAIDRLEFDGGYNAMAAITD